VASIRAQSDAFVQQGVAALPAATKANATLLASETARLNGEARRQFGTGELSPTAEQGINIVTLLVAIGGVSWLTMARVIRGQVLSLKAQPFMEAARAIGVPVPRQFARHLLPNLIGPIVVYATLTVPQAILQESFLSFLGIGVKPPLPSWGNLAADGLSELNTVRSHWWMLLAPCVLLALTLLALNFLGEALREKLDPKRKAR
ncbi:MAG: ABC transporter permease, partial [Phycisphaerales bacterium]|nr:ABC transporter permease [Phycisphaerales bacterium]